MIDEKVLKNKLRIATHYHGTFAGISSVFMTVGDDGGVINAMPQEEPFVARDGWMPMESDIQTSERLMVLQLGGNQTETDCKMCAFCRMRINEKDEITLFSCNEAGMMATKEAYLPKNCERWKKRTDMKE